MIGRGRLTRILSSAIAMFAGRISYALYMVHMLVLGAGIGILRAHDVGHINGSVIMTIVASFAATVIIATYLYYRVEDPARRAMVRLPSPLLNSRGATAAEPG